VSGIVDTSVFCGCWPFRPTALRSAADLKTRLEAGGVRQAWVAPVEAVLAPDPMQANEPLFAEVAEIADIGGDDFFVAVAAVNPTLATWRSDTETCLANPSCRALKLFPSYHAYELSAAHVDELADLAGSSGAAGVPVCVQMLMMDQRSQHHAAIVEPPSPGAVAELALRHPGTRFLACGVLTAQLEELAAAPNVWAEISHVESDQALRKAVDVLGPGGGDRIVFGSHSPYHYLEAMAAKLDAAPEDVDPATVEKVRGLNAAELLGG